MPRSLREREPDLPKARVNGGPWREVVEHTCTPQFEHVRSERPIMVPRSGWLHVDSNGHVHAWALRPEGRRTGPMRELLPTLRAREVHVECDGSCVPSCDGEGWHVTKYACAQCEEDVEPGYREGPSETVIDMGTEWTFVLAGLWWEPESGASHLLTPVGLTERVSIEVKGEHLHHDEKARMHLFGWGYPGPVEALLSKQTTDYARSPIERCTVWSVA